MYNEAKQTKTNLHKYFHPSSSLNMILAQCACAMQRATKVQQNIPILKKVRVLCPTRSYYSMVHCRTWDHSYNSMVYCTWDHSYYSMVYCRTWDHSWLCSPSSSPVQSLPEHLKYTDSMYTIHVLVGGIVSRVFSNVDNRRYFRILFFLKLYLRC